MTNLIHRIFGHSDAPILCPRCEQPLEGHSEADCARKMSRRWFLGATLGAVAGAVVAPTLAEITTEGFSGDVLRAGDVLTLNLTGTLSKIGVPQVEFVIQKCDTLERIMVVKEVPMSGEPVFIAPGPMHIESAKFVSSFDNTVRDLPVTVRRANGLGWGQVG